MKKTLLLSLCLLLAIAEVFAQTHTVTGKVTGKDDGLPIPGVSVSISGTTTGTQTNAEGKYTVTVADGAKLTFSFIGYAPQTLTVNGNVLNVILAASSQQLGEV